MAKNSIRDFSATAGSNTDIQSVNIDENCPASGINNALRELMVDLKNVSTGAVNLETPGADQLNVDNLRLDGNTISSTDTNGDITLDPNGTGAVVVDAGHSLGVGTATPESFYSLADDIVLGTGSGGRGLTIYSGSSDSGYIGFNDTASASMSGFIQYNHDGDYMAFAPNGSEKVRIASDGTIIFNDAVKIGGNSASSIFRANASGSGIHFSLPGVLPSDGTGQPSDNTQNLGAGSFRWTQLHAANGTIQTSDQNEKQDIASLTTAEMTAAKAISKLFKTFKWKDKVAAKGDAARTHTGVIAQEVQTAMSDAGLDASKYAFWCSDTWTNDDGNEQTRLGVRYAELLAFIGAATEQRLADIETRLTALEA